MHPEKTTKSAIRAVVKYTNKSDTNWIKNWKKNSTINSDEKQDETHKKWSGEKCNENCDGKCSEPYPVHSGTFCCLFRRNSKKCDVSTNKTRKKAYESEKTTKPEAKGEEIAASKQLCNLNKKREPRQEEIPKVKRETELEQMCIPDRNLN